jgi:hypothetical protein
MGERIGVSRDLLVRLLSQKPGTAQRREAGHATLLNTAVALAGYPDLCAQER